MSTIDQQKSNTTFYASLDAKGRVVLPLELRKQARVKAGDVMAISFDRKLTMHVSPVPKKVTSLRGLLKSNKQKVSVVDDFISERRKEALLDD